MPNKLAHFAIEAEDVQRALAFYQTVFGWRFEPWGPPDFYLIHEAWVHGALQKSTTNQRGTTGFQLSFAVHNLKDSMGLVQQAGGKVIGSKHTIPTVGDLIHFEDTEGNEATLVQYEPTRAVELGFT